MPIVHKLLSGDGAERLLPFGLSKLREWAEFYPGLPFKQTFEHDGFTVHIKQVGEFQYLWIFGGGPYFEFFTSGSPASSADVTTEGFTFDRYNVACVGVGLQLGTDPDGNDKIILSPSIRGSRRVTDGRVVSKVKRPCQINLYDEPVVYVPSTGTTFPRTLYESWAPGHAHTGVYTRCLNIEGAQGTWTHRPPWTAHLTRDVAFDIPYQDGRGQAKVRDAIIRTVDWPRANAIQSVTHTTYGTREFAVYVDAFNQFTVFPTASILAFNEDGSQNVPAAVVQTVTPDLPVWVHKPTQAASEYLPLNNTEKWLIEFPELDWKFNHLGTKACSVVYERQEATFDATYFATDATGSPHTPPNSGTIPGLYPYSGFPARHASKPFDSSYLPQRYILGTGLVELTVTISLTGTDPEDYEVDVSCAEIRRPTTSEYCTFMAGYSWVTTVADEEAEEPVITASPGDLLVLDIERYFQPDRVPFSEIVSFFSLKNLTTEEEIRTLPGFELIDYDWPTVSFVTELQDYEVHTRELGPPLTGPVPTGSLPATNTVTYNTTHRAAAVFTKGHLREVLYPDIMDADTRTRIAELSVQELRDLLVNDSMDATLDWEFLPLNDVRDWTDATVGGLKQLRDYWANFFGWKTPFTPPYSTVTLTTRLTNWWEIAMAVYFTPQTLLFVSTPNPGWHMYTDEIINRLYVTPHSTFFVHPNGTWAFYDQSVLYNRHGLPVSGSPVGTNYYDTLTPFLEDDAAIEHVIYDRVHFALTKKDGTIVTRDTSFRELYNTPAANSDGEDVLTIFEPVTKPELRAQLEKTAVAAGGGLTILELHATWNEVLYRKLEPYYHGGIQFNGITADAGDLLDGTLDSTWYNADYSAFVIPQDVGRKTTFSQCVLLGV